MNQGIIELYSDDDLALLKQQIKRRCIAHILLAAAALAACIVMISLTGTTNAWRMELAVIAVSTVTGWIILYGSIFVVAVRWRELKHASMLRSEERQAVSGTVTVTHEKVAIRRSITARRVEVRSDHDAEQLHRLLVCETQAAALAASGATTLHTVHGYVAAYEVTQ